MQKPTLDKFPPSVLRQIDIQKAFIASRLIVATERLQLFRFLHARRAAAAEIGSKLKIRARYLQPVLNALVSLGLLNRRGATYGNSPLAEKYFIRERSIYWTRQYSAECAEAYESLTTLEQRLKSGKHHDAIRRNKKLGYVESMKRNPRQAENFTQMLFHLHQPEAAALAEHLDLTGREAVLDAGGGSGVMSIALAKRNPHLRACVLDIGPVCEVAARNIRQAGLSRRVQTQAGDIRKGWPKGYDVVMFCDVGAMPMAMLRHAYHSLPPRGLVVLVDRYFSDDGTEPLDRLLEYFASSSSFGLATRRDMVQLLKACGFRQVKAARILQDVWCITGAKPAASAAPALSGTRTTGFGSRNNH